MKNGAIMGLIAQVALVLSEGEKDAKMSVMSTINELEEYNAASFQRDSFDIKIGGFLYIPLNQARKLFAKLTSLR